MVHFRSLLIAIFTAFVVHFCAETYLAIARLMRAKEPALCYLSAADLISHDYVLLTTRRNFLRLARILR
jgi:hypothetical protein